MSIDTTAAPGCPAWCTTSHNDPTGWEVTGGIRSKTCRHIATVPDVDGPVDVELERFASVENGRTIVDAPVVRVLAGATLTLTAAAALAGVLARLTDLAAAAGIIAA